MIDWLYRLFGIHRHHWIYWSEIDQELGFQFDYMRCDKPGCKWSGLTWVDRERLPR